MIINEEISIKEYYRFIEFTSKYCGYELVHERLKLISLDGYRSESKIEMEVKRFKDGYLYLINNLNQSLNLEMLEKSYYLLTKEEIEEKDKIEILEEIYRNYDEGIYSLVSKVHLKILERINNKGIEYAFMISNYLMKKRKRGTLILYPSNYEEYRGIIERKEKKKLELLFFKIERKFKKKEVRKITKEEIIEKIKVIREELQEEYEIEKLYLFGSYVKEETLEESDIDLIIIFKEGLINIERQKIYNKLKERLTNLLGREVDILDFYNGIKKFDISEIERIITLI